MANPRCFFDVTIGGADAGRIVMEVSLTNPAGFEGFALTLFTLRISRFHGAYQLLKWLKGMWQVEIAKPTAYTECVKGLIAA